VWQGKFQFSSTNLTNEQVYEKFMKGRQVGDKEDDFEMDIDLTGYRARTNTIGYTYPSVVGTWLNKKFLDWYTPANVCGNVSHEYCHKIGFSHDYAWTKQRAHSVPYAIGYMIEEVAEVYVNAKYDDKVLGYNLEKGKVTA
jgi:hypothetical protein